MPAELHGYDRILRGGLAIRRSLHDGNSTDTNHNDQTDRQQLGGKSLENGGIASPNDEGIESIADHLVQRPWRNSLDEAQHQQQPQCEPEPTMTESSRKP